MNTNSLKVEKIVNGGYGLGRRGDGQVVLLRNSLAGEIIAYTVREQRTKLVFAETESILVNNPARRQPPCPYYGSCGGCNLQHCTYQEQSRIKDGIAQELLQTSPVQAAVMPPIVPSPMQFGYRQRIRLQNNGDKLGFLQFRSEKIAPIDACLLAHPTINTVLGDIVGTDEFSKLRGGAEEIEFLFNPQTARVSCLFYLANKPRPLDRERASALVERSDTLERIFFTGTTFALEGPYCGQTGNNSRLFSQTIHIKSPALTSELTWEVGGFCQVNLLQNHNMINHVLQRCGDVTAKTILDLYCGMGNFSIPLARSAQSLLGIEGQGAAIRCARQNSAAAGLTNTVFIKGPIHQMCSTLVLDNRKFAITIIDPPRQGAPGLADQLFSLTGEKLIYISCDPATLRRDLIELCHRGFNLVEVQPFDMFPQTHHIETVAVLEKN